MTVYELLAVVAVCATVLLTVLFTGAAVVAIRRAKEK